MAPRVTNLQGRLDTRTQERDAAIADRDQNHALGAWAAAERDYNHALGTYAAAERDNLQAQVTAMQDALRRSPLNFLRDHPFAGGAIIAAVPLLVGLLVWFTRKYVFTSTPWPFVITFGTLILFVFSVAALSQWRRAHRLDHP